MSVTGDSHFPDLSNPHLDTDEGIAGFLRQTITDPAQVAKIERLYRTKRAEGHEPYPSLIEAMKDLYPANENTSVMKTLGLIGGIGWESTASYYRFINEDVRARCGSLYSARLLLNSLQFQTIDSLARTGQWNHAADHLIEAARTLEKAGAEGLVLCSNLMHFVAGQIEASVGIPLLHLGDAIVDTVRGRAASVGLLGTRFTLEHGFLMDRRPHPRWGTSRIHTPSPEDGALLDRIIYGELCRGEIRSESRTELFRMAHDLRQHGASVVVLASSELALLLKPDDSPAWLYDSTELHSAAAVRWMFGETRTPVDRTKPVMSVEPGGTVKKRSQLSPLRRADSH